MEKITVELDLSDDLIALYKTNLCNNELDW